jgi:hypothetical protein
LSELIASTPITYGASASVTSVSRVVPPQAVDGALIMAVVMNRSTLTAPAGWTRVLQQRVPAGSAVDQWLEIWSKVAQSDAGQTVTFTQSTAARMAMLLLVSSGQVSAFAFDSLLGPSEEEVPAVPNAPAGLQVSVATCVYGADGVWYAFPAGWTQLTATPGMGHEASRVAVGVRSVAAGAAGAASLSHNIGISHEAAMASLVAAGELSPPPPPPPLDADLASTPIFDAELEPLPAVPLVRPAAWVVGERESE